MAIPIFSGKFKRHFKIAKAWIPRKCFICKKKGGWGKKNVDTIWVHGFKINYFWAHFHQHCLKDAICYPENYKNEIVERAVNIHNKWEELLLEDTKDRVEKRMLLEKAQKSICERS